MLLDIKQFACRKCGTINELYQDEALRDGSQAPCYKCGTPFAFFIADKALASTDRSSAPAQHQDETPAGRTEPASVIRRFSFHGSGGSLFGIRIVNLLLILITLGVYFFWAKVRLRSYLLSQTEMEGDRFAYHGTGRELLIGFLKASLVFGVPYLGLQLSSILLDLEMPGQIVVMVLGGFLILVFLSVAIVSARRYRLSRTSWRGIRFSFRGRTLDFMKLFFVGGFLTGITLGAYYPLYATKRQLFMVEHSFFGDRQFRFDGEGWDLYTSYLTAYLLTPMTLGLSWFWFAASKQRYFWNHTTIDGARFHSTVRGGPLARLKIANLFILVLSLGFAWPWVTVRNARFILTNLALEGAVDLATIKQTPQIASSTGEGLSGFLDSGFDLG